MKTINYENCPRTQSEKYTLGWIFTHFARLFRAITFRIGEMRSAGEKGQWARSVCANLEFTLRRWRVFMTMIRCYYLLTQLLLLLLLFYYYVYRPFDALFSFSTWRVIVFWCELDTIMNTITAVRIISLVIYVLRGSWEFCAKVKLWKESLCLIKRHALTELQNLFTSIQKNAHSSLWI